MQLFDEGSTAQTNPNGLIQQAWVAYKGNTNWPSPGAAKYLKAVIAANELYRKWALDSKVHWDSLWVLRTTGPVASTQQAYDLDSDIFYLSDWVYINRTDGNIDRFQVVHPEARNSSFNAIGAIGSDWGDPMVYLTGTFAHGDSNLTMNFQTPFTQLTGDVGGTIEFGAYALPDPFQNPTDIILMNNPDWLVKRLAAELARNDPSKEDQVDNLMLEAQNLYDRMVKDNQGNSYQQPNSPNYSMRQIGQSWQSDF